MMHESGAIEEDVHGADIGGGCTHRIGVGDVEMAGADTAEPVQTLELVFVYVRGDYLCTLVGKGLGRGAANPLGSRSYQRPLSSQSVSHPSSPSAQRVFPRRLPYSWRSMDISSHGVQDVKGLRPTARS